MEYRVRVTDMMRVWKLVGSESEETEPLGYGEYRFLLIDSPVLSTSGSWIVLKREYDRGAIIGRHVMSIGDRFCNSEGFTLEEVSQQARKS